MFAHFKVFFSAEKARPTSCLMKEEEIKDSQSDDLSMALDLVKDDIRLHIIGLIYWNLWLYHQQMALIADRRWPLPTYSFFIVYFQAEIHV